MYHFVLGLHNTTRWLILAGAAFALFRTYGGLFGKRSWAKPDRVSLRAYSGLLDAQFLLGLIMYVGLSPMMRTIWSNFGAAMKDDHLRFFAVEHIFMMVVGVVLGHVAVIAAKRAKDDHQKFKRAAIWVTASIVVILAGIPWWRPLVPHF